MRFQSLITAVTLSSRHFASANVKDEVDLPFRSSFVGADDVTTSSTTNIVSSPGSNGQLFHPHQHHRDLGLSEESVEADAMRAFKLVNATEKFTHGDFSPLSCNGAGLDTCVAWSSFASGTTVADKVTIPCNTCVTMGEYTAGETIDLQGGLDILGRLYIPEESRVTIQTPFIFVQGKLSIRSTSEVTGTPKVKVVLVGTEEVLFVPHADNADSCDPEGCQVGKKPIVVAGGFMDVKAFPDDCPTWVHVIKDSVPSVIEVDEYPQLPTLPDSCDEEELLNVDFSSDSDLWDQTQALYELTDEDHDSQYIRVSNRTGYWQGLMLDLPMDCLAAPADYLISLKIRLSKEGGTSDCYSDLESCPLLKLYSGDEPFEKPLSLMGRYYQTPDGEWFEWFTSFDIPADYLENNNGTLTISLSGPEESVIMDVDDVRISLPPTTSYPDPTHVCENLVQNGSPDPSQKFTFPLRSFRRDEEMTIETEGNTTYYHLENRQFPYSTITWDLTPDCLLVSSVYLFQTRVRVHSIDPVNVQVVLKVHDLEMEGHPYTYTPIAMCAGSSETIGWVECVSKYTFREVHANSESVQVLFVTASELFPLDVTDISFELLALSSDMNLPPSVKGCWGPDAQILTTSQCLDFDSHNTGTIKEVNDEGVVTFNEIVRAPISLEESAQFASEVALLSRNVMFTSAQDDHENQEDGGHLLVLGTPSTEDNAQLIVGVNFDYFGQEGKRSREPITFYISGDNSGSLVCKNSITSSHRRAIVIHGTHNVNVTNNIAFNITGHMFVLEDGSETGNVFIDNLGAYAKRAKITAAYEMDHSPAIFLIKNPDNTYVGNMAAGAEDSGFWIQVEDIVSDESLFMEEYDDVHPNTIPLRLFKDNIAHSNMGHGIKTYPFGYHPSEQSVFENIISFQNRGSGIYFINGDNITIETAQFADNRIAMDLNYLDNSYVNNVVATGLSPWYKKHSGTFGFPRHCWGSSLPIYGTRLGLNSRNRKQSPGVSFTNVTFDTFNDRTGCLKSTSITYNTLYNRPVYEATAYFTNVTFNDHDGQQDILDICGLRDIGVKDLFLIDDGSLNPSGDGEAGKAVSDNEMMTQVGTCVPMTGSCAQYCTGNDSCLRKISIGVPSQTDNHTVLSYFDGTTERTATGFFQQMGFFYDYHWNSRYFIDVMLPARNYTLELRDQDNAPIWPVFVEVFMGAVQDCEPYLEGAALEVPDAPAGQCDSLVVNGDFEDGLNAWYHTGYHHSLYGNGMELETVDVYEGSKALASHGRSDPEAGLAQYLDTRCMNEGEWYEVEAMVKMIWPKDKTIWPETDEQSSPPDCDVDRYLMGGTRCPRFNIRTSENWVATSYVDAIANTLSPFEPGEWNYMHGEFFIDENMAKADSIGFYVEGPRIGVDLIVDNVACVKRTDTCENLARNGDLETGNNKYWGYKGPMTGNKIIPGSGSTYGLSSKKRDYWYASLTQRFNADCLVLGDEYEINAMVKIVDYEGNTLSCNPLQYYLNEDSCPTLAVTTEHLTNEEETDGYTYVLQKIYKKVLITDEVGFPFAQTSYDDGWIPLFGTFTVNQELIDAYRSWIRLYKAPAGVNIAIDNLSITKVNADTYGQHQCTDLVRNGDGERGDLKSWVIKGVDDMGTVNMISPGATGNYAFHHTGTRSEFFNGLWQKLDKECMPLQSSWTVRAKFKLFDENGDAVSCSKLSRSYLKQCPMFLFQSMTRKNGIAHMDLPLLNHSPGEWVLGEWNDFENTFVMSEDYHSQYSIWILIHNIRPDYTYMVDDISVTPYVAEE